MDGPACADRPVETPCAMNPICVVCVETPSAKGRSRCFFSFSRVMRDVCAAAAAAAAAAYTAIKNRRGKRGERQRPHDAPRTFFLLSCLCVLSVCLQYKLYTKHTEIHTGGGRARARGATTATRHHPTHPKPPLLPWAPILSYDSSPRR